MADEAGRAVYETHWQPAVVALAARFPEGPGVMGTSIKQLTGFLGDFLHRQAVWRELVAWALGRPETAAGSSSTATCPPAASSPPGP